MNRKEMNRKEMNGRPANRRNPAGIFLSTILVLAMILSSCGGQTEGAGAAQETPIPASESVSDERPVVEEESGDLPVFDKASLAEYDGKEGRPTYVAIDGKVYDISHVSQWNMGFHNGFSAGQDLTSAIGLSPHGKAMLERQNAVVVGVYEE